MSTTPLTFGNIGSMLLRRKWLLVTSGVLCAALGWLTSEVMPQTYTSVGSLIVENGEPNVPELGMGIGSANTNPEGVVLTQVEVLHSYGLVERVVDELKLGQNSLFTGSYHWPPYLERAYDKAMAHLPHIGGAPLTNEQIVEYMYKHLRVESTERSSLITIRYPSGSSALSVNIVNTLMRAYLDGDVARRDSQIKQVNAWLTARAEELQQEAQQADVQVTQFIGAHPQLSEVQGGQPAAIQLNVLQSKLADAQQELAQRQAAYDTLTKGGAAANEVLSSPTIRMYKEREAVLQAQIAALPLYDPRRSGYEQALAALRSQVTTEKAQIALALRRSVDLARGNVESLQAALAGPEKRERSAASDAAKLANLKSTAAAKKQLFVAFGSRSEQTRIAAAQLASARILYPAFPLPRHATTVPAVMVGFVAGLIFVGAVVVLRAALQNRVITSQDVAIAISQPVIASLPRMDVRRPVPHGVTETIRAMWWNVLSSDSKSAVVLVTSSDTGEGKTTFTAMMSRRLAADGARVLVIDGDLRRRGLTKLFRGAPQVSLHSLPRTADALRGGIAHDLSGVDCFLPDRPMDNPMLLFQSDAFQSFLRGCKRDYDVIFVDSPPILRVADAVVLARVADHVLFVVAAGLVTTDAVAEALNRLPLEDRRKVSPVVLRVQRGDLSNTDYYSGYGREPA